MSWHTIVVWPESKAMLLSGSNFFDYVAFCMSDPAGVVIIRLDFWALLVLQR